MGVEPPDPAGVADADAPRLEFDQLLTQLIEQARDIQGAQNRLHGLLRANRSVIGDLSLEGVLRRIVEAACELVQAPYGALGVISPGGGLEQFIHVGMDPATVDEIGRLPEGKGLLGALIEDPRPIRLRDISDDIRSVGFPDGHPPMRGFLGVPIRVRQEVFGNLYLASLSVEDFRGEDVELVSALAATAGAAIENARLYEESRRRQAWLESSTKVTRQLLTSADDDALRLIGQSVADLADADLVSVVLPNHDRSELHVPVAVGVKAERLAGLRFPAVGTVSEQVLTSGHPLVFDDASDTSSREAGTLLLSTAVTVGPAMLLPLAGREGVLGVLAVGRVRGRRAFTEADVDMAATFASHASLALELADARLKAQRMALLDDRARIARDLHDHVIQQLFAAGMTLQGIAGSVNDSAVSERLGGVVDTVDDAIRQIRTSIFQLRPQSLLGAGVRSRVMEMVTELTPSLGYDPRVHFQGAVDTVSDDDLADDVAAVVREALANVAKHAGATRVDVILAIEGSMLLVVVQDDGAGLRDTKRSSGLGNLGRRASERGGSLEVETGAGGVGTSLTWRVPLP